MRPKNQACTHLKSFWPKFILNYMYHIHICIQWSKSVMILLKTYNVTYDFGEKTFSSLNF